MMRLSLVSRSSRFPSIRRSLQTTALVTFGLVVPAHAVKFTLVQNGSGTHLTAFWEQITTHLGVQTYHSCADFSCCLDATSVNGVIGQNGCGSAAGMGGSLIWSTDAIPHLRYSLQLDVDSGGCTYGHATAVLDAATHPLVFRIDPEMSDPNVLSFDVRIVPVLCCDAIIEPSGDTAQGSADASFFVKVNGATATQDALSLALTSSTLYGFPGGGANTVVVPGRHYGDEITIGASYALAVTSTGAGTAQLSTCSSSAPNRILVDVYLQNLTTAVPEPTASALRLEPAFPNPFNPVTTIPYSIPAAGAVRLTVHDPQGRRVQTLVDAVQAPGAHAFVWDGRDRQGMRVASGVYLARLSTSEETQSRRIVLAR